MSSDVLPVIALSGVTFAYPASDPVLRDVSVDVPPGVTGVVGPNGIGKSTLLLLGGARLFPADGAVRILGEDAARFRAASADPSVEERRNRVASFVYQNMEFETEESVEEILRYVDGARGDARVQADPLDRVVQAMELGGDLGKRMQELSKGAMQRTIIALSLLYGAPLLLMDEPVFALAPSRADRVFEYLRDYSVRFGVSIVYSAHDVEFTRRHSDNALLFYENPDAREGDDGSDHAGYSSDQGGPFPRVEAGRAVDILSRKNLESAYRAPLDTLKQRETLYREMLNRA